MSATPLPSRRLFLGMAAAVPLSTTGVLTLGNQSASAATTSPFVMAYFTQSPRNLGTDYGLHLAVSTDALQWMPLNQNNPVVTPTAGDGGLRDPFILPRQDGTYVVMATNLKGTDWTRKTPYIHVWDSADLRSFDSYRLLKLHDMATHTWAPEAFWDPSRGQYALIYSAVNSSGHNVIMVNYTTDFQTVTAPQVFFDPGYDIIDGTLAKDVNGVNYLYYKGRNSLVGARSTSLAPGSFTQFTSGLAPQGGIEGPILTEASGTWYLWGDANALFYAYQTDDLSTGTWTATDRRVHTQPLNSKHADIKPIPQTVYDNMITKWGKPAWNRLKSYNFPDRYWRQVDSLGRIDPYPFDPYTDSQWKLVPGLADPSGVSFQSVNQPTRYLRHAYYQLRLDANDGTTLFAQDATFHRTAGLADPSWSSFRSHNHPDRYIRHFNYALRIDPISTATGRGDATFSVWY
ncbi:glycoside hydrolase family 43 protein [Streptomyces scabiei]|uniref:glycoside hydrolase family 43 protein n=1 Tax=Streptomyces scabiei TaxID=1930 RepID=UPI001B3314FD|nr:MULTISPECIES: glycoside hydrolase family 43 protein [Streptomyces]MBP5889632.1 alpha-L-arabinofuranosidase [Streptomyces sp. LBUM 1481]MBP5919655.1 alpha-L-arabinofuranosidase [Streptomyces sp. LBUM 1483]MDX2685574.1 glycoside hydrolase family 43 protein [Streptomyces scabiei]MDX2750569.1 glycoside hydrolase family 43 protein [Streptomyces scabiei]MDX2803851.1 glycoside hydrolase family 43 protein [Streptomyces scabiei]